MIKNFQRLFVFILFLLSLSCSSEFQESIDRKSVVERHTIISDTLDLRSPAQVGNGEFAFSVDITGLQTFVPFNTMSHWGWHSDPVPIGTEVGNFMGQMVDTYGRMVKYPLVNNDNEEQRALSDWLSGNPQRINLGRIAFSLTKADGTEVRSEDLQYCRQEINLWTGIISSYFEIEGNPVYVKAGIYREEVVPPRSGTSREKPIIYLAVPGEDVSIRASEQITARVKQDGNVWMIELDNSF